jgi:hypothetical protein
MVQSLSAVRWQDAGVVGIIGHLPQATSPQLYFGPIIAGIRRHLAFGSLPRLTGLHERGGQPVLRHAQPVGERDKARQQPGQIVPRAATRYRRCEAASIHTLAK